MQKMPWDVRAYRKFSIRRLQLRHLKHGPQNAWSPVRIARSSILLLQELQLYVQSLQMSDPSPRRRRFASESRRVPQLWHRKQSICQRLPAITMLISTMTQPINFARWGLQKDSMEYMTSHNRINGGYVTHRAQKLCPPLASGPQEKR